MKRKLMMVSMMAILSLSLFACGSKDTTSSSNGSARTNTEKKLTQRMKTLAHLASCLQTMK